jgi:para-nitrobenzyl esterase
MDRKTKCQLLLTLPFFCVFLLQGCSYGTKVRVEQGLLSGTRGEDFSIKVYKGVHYAAPPVAHLRWQPPRSPEKWKGTRSADTYPPACPQQLQRSMLPWTEEFMHQGEVNEDCLYLNIWTGADPENGKLPVMVYIHGGAFTSGSNAVEIYNGEALAQKGVVVVAVNYRLGVLGFLSLPELTRESDHRTSGNYGLLDQASALWWIHNNIAAFGGDPENVTIFGQSAGAMSVAMLMQSPLAEGLFRRAIIQSGPGLFPENFLSGNTSLEKAEEAGLRFAEAKGAKNLADLRAMPVADLLDVPQGISIGPIRDGYFLPANTDSSKQVPVINGFTADDMGAGGNLGPAPDTTPQAYEKDARENYGDGAGRFLSLYPAFSYSEVAQMRKASGRDRARVSLYLWASKQDEKSDEVYTYYFDRAIPWPEHPEFGAFHSGELPYVFNNLDLMKRPWEEIDHKLADQMSSYWTNFARTGDPNGPELPHWPKFDPSKEQTMRLGDNPGPINVADREKLAFWKEVLTGGGPQ